MDPGPDRPNATRLEGNSPAQRRNLSFQGLGRLFTKSAQSSGPENVGPERPLPSHLAPWPVLSPSRITLEYNEKIRPRPDRENAFAGASGGERGIRTLETVPRLHTFQACAFDHSAISPAARQEHFRASRARGPLRAEPAQGAKDLGAQIGRSRRLPANLSLTLVVICQRAPRMAPARAAAHAPRPGPEVMAGIRLASLCGRSRVDPEGGIPKILGQYRFI